MKITRKCDYCERPLHTKGMCSMHAGRMYHHGTLEPYKKRPGEVVGEFYHVPIKGSDSPAIVSIEDADVDFHSWSLTYDGYARATIKQRGMSMHRFIMGLEIGDPRLVDHINGDGLDNRRSNLRMATYSDNNRNRRPNGRGGSNYKGVYRGWGKDYWEVRIACDYKAIYLGSTYDETEAALMYDIAAIQLHGEYARLNIL